MNALDLVASKVRLFRNLSYREFFSSYSPVRDGRVWASTYSFSSKAFDFWDKFPPVSVIFVSPNKTQHMDYAEEARRLARKFPLFEVRIVPKLHTKAILFEESRRLLVSSQNIFSEESSFEEVAVELQVPDEKLDEVKELIFSFRNTKPVVPTFTQEDLRVYKSGSAKGKVFLPCHRQIANWQYTLETHYFKEGEFHSASKNREVPGFIHFVNQYRVGDSSRYVAFDRGYSYCGDLSQDAFQWMIERCERLPDVPGGFVGGNTMGKDRIFSFHPIASSQTPVVGFVFDKIKKTVNVDSARLVEFKPRIIELLS